MKPSRPGPPTESSRPGSRSARSRGTCALATLPALLSTGVRGGGAGGLGGGMHKVTNRHPPFWPRRVGPLWLALWIPHAPWWSPGRLSGGFAEGEGRQQVGPVEPRSPSPFGSNPYSGSFLLPVCGSKRCLVFVVQGGSGASAEGQLDHQCPARMSPQTSVAASGRPSRPLPHSVPSSIWRWLIRPLLCARQQGRGWGRKAGWQVGPCPRAPLVLLVALAMQCCRTWEESCLSCREYDPGEERVRHLVCARN